MEKQRRRIDWTVVLSRTVLFSILWWVLTDGAAGAWGIGVPAVASAMLVSVKLMPRERLVWREVFGFIPFFLWHSLKGGIDVAWRVFQPRMPIAPTIIEFPLRLPPGLPQVALINIMSLLPGTLSAELEGQVLKVHVLDGRKDVLPDLKALEQRVGRMWKGAAVNFTGR